MGSKDVACLGPGQLFGEMGILDSSPRSATVLASEKTVLFSITRNVLTSKLPILSNKILVGIAKQLAEKVRKANELINKMST